MWSERVFESENLVLHPGLVSTGSTQALGCDLRGDLLASRVTPERYHKLRPAIGGLLARKKVSGRLLEVVSGHATFVGLTCRPVLSVFNTVYRYIRSHYERPATLWPTVRQELQAFRGLMVFLHADWGRPWNPYVSASDASLQGFGVISAIWSRDGVAKVGRNLESSRFRKEGCHSAREAALTAAGFVRDEVTQLWRAGWIDSEDYLQKKGWGLSKSFKEVPSDLLQADLWTPRLWGKWQYEAGILELEARALVKSLRRIALSTFGHDIRQLLLTDNMSVCLAFDRSRARNHSLLIQIRRFASYCLARNISCTVRWVPSELNSADHPSRLDSEESGKTLAHVIPAIRRPAAGENPSATPVAAKSGGEEWKETVKRASAQTTQGAHSPAEGFGQSPPHSKAAGPWPDWTARSDEGPSSWLIPT